MNEDPLNFTVLSALEGLTKLTGLSLEDDRIKRSAPPLVCGRCARGSLYTRSKLALAVFQARQYVPSTNQPWVCSSVPRRGTGTNTISPRSHPLRRRYSTRPCIERPRRFQLMLDTLDGVAPVSPDTR